MTKLEMCERRAQEGENMIDTEAIREHIRGILVALGDDPEIGRASCRERV